MIKFGPLRYLSLLCLFLLCFGSIALASDPTEFFREWSKIDVSGPIGPELSDVRYEAFVESRNQETRLDSAGGFRITPLVSFWNGFTWISPNDGSPRIYRPWQHVVWELLDKNSPIQFQTRTRLEELKQESQPEWLWRVRERWRVSFPNLLAKKFTPVISDEIFLNVNKPVWVNPGVVDQNRAFIGVDSPTWKHTFVEIGYLNQYRYTTPVNQMAHIALVTFMISFP
jgi:uncharacterized protein DUF2490